jgi:hypothetical protein
MNIENVLARLEKVKQTGKETYIACCPSHDDRTPSLSIRGLPDGRILIHCFSGCDVYSILSSIGLEITDLFPHSLGEYKKITKPFPAADVLAAVGFECLIVINSATKLIGGEIFTADDRTRLVLSVSRIQLALNAGGYQDAKY